MFAYKNTNPPCGIFTKGHFILLGITLLCIAVALKFTVNKNEQQVHKIIRRSILAITVMEVIKIIYAISEHSIYDVEKYMPLYYCSILIYAGLLSSFGKGKLKRTGDVFLATGSIVGGIVFVIYPSTSLPYYSVDHLLSIYSFIFHGLMIYLGILVNKTNYIKLEKSDIKYFAALIGSLSAIALVVNRIFDSNLMFVSKNFQGTPLEIIYRITGGSFVFTFVMITGQIVCPFYIPYAIIKKEELQKYKFRKIAAENV